MRAGVEVSEAEERLWPCLALPVLTSRPGGFAEEGLHLGSDPQPPASGDCAARQGAASRSAPSSTHGASDASPAAHLWRREPEILGTDGAARSAGPHARAGLTRALSAASSLTPLLCRGLGPRAGAPRQENAPDPSPRPRPRPASAPAGVRGAGQGRGRDGSPGFRADCEQGWGRRRGPGRR
ncbi:PREDICTED: collagen alpha-2(I) chain-like [Chinchilla lanigera]|uniref:collagen alpha-2(I) chain-like n=1 Tax=Chinchilla lanigera TaxID=34839 RepID=UPI000696398A|nr:PREDICTED: collagen alpha-2(I) chain-like [Chinchilla lanigera]